MQGDVTLFLTELRAIHAAQRHAKPDETVSITRGVVRWADGTTDQGFKVKLTRRGRRWIVGQEFESVRYL